MSNPSAPPIPVGDNVQAARADLPKAKARSRFRGAAWFMAPSIVLTFIFVYGFIAFSGVISLSQWKRPTRRDLSLRDPFGATYVEMFGEQRFQAGMRNVIIFTILFLALSVIGGLLMAILVHNVVVGRGLFRSVFLLPYALSFIVTGVAFRWIFNPNEGINVWLRDLGIENLPRWSTDPTVALAIVKPSGQGFLQIDLGIPLALIPIIIAAAWQLSGFAMAMYLAGLAGIPAEELEAASMDGAGWFNSLRYVVLPQLWPITVTCLILLLHTSLKIFDLVVAMSGSGPGFVTDVPGIYVYDMMGKANRYDKGTAAAIVLLLTACVFVVPYLIRVYRKEGRS
jgi:glucose/mannose transport system permease protein